MDYLSLRGEERIAKMKRLREDELLNDVQIGALFGICRERVAQLIGRKGRYIDRQRKEKIWRENKNLSNAELSQLMNVGKGVLTRYRGKEWHKAENQTEAQEIVSKILCDQGIGNEILQRKCTRRIVLENGKKIHVCASNALDLYGTGAKSYTFSTRNEKCDFYLCVCLDTKDVFVIPFRKVRLATPIRFTFPCTHVNKSKWLAYHGRFDLLK